MAGSDIIGDIWGTDSPPASYEARLSAIREALGKDKGKKGRRLKMPRALQNIIDEAARQELISKGEGGADH